MLFVVLIYRNKIIRVCPWFYFYFRLVYGECSVSSLRICVFYYPYFENGVSGTEGDGQFYFLGFFFSAALSLLIYLYVPVVTYLH